MRSSNNQNSRTERDSQQNYQQDFSRRDRGQFRDDSETSSLNQRDSSASQDYKYGSDKDRGYDYSSNSGRQFNNSMKGNYNSQNSQGSDEARYGAFQDHDSNHASTRADRGYNNQMSSATSMIGQKGNFADQGYGSQEQGYGSQEQGYRSQEAFPGQHAYGSQGHSLSQRNDWGTQPSYNSQQRSGPSQGKFSGMGPKGYKRSDDRIREDVCEALTHDAGLDASNIDVEVKEGIITLSGTVDTRSTKHHAEMCVEHLSGVKDIINNLRIDTSASMNMSSSTKTDRYNGMSASTSATLASPSLSTTPTSKKSVQ